MNITLAAAHKILELPINADENQAQAAFERKLRELDKEYDRKYRALLNDHAINIEQILASIRHPLSDSVKTSEQIHEEIKLRLLQESVFTKEEAQSALFDLNKKIDQLFGAVKIILEERHREKKLKIEENYRKKVDEIRRKSTDDGHENAEKYLRDNVKSMRNIFVAVGIPLATAFTLLLIVLARAHAIGMELTFTTPLKVMGLLGAGVAYGLPAVYGKLWIDAKKKLNEYLAKKNILNTHNQKNTQK